MPYARRIVRRPARRYTRTSRIVRRRAPLQMRRSVRMLSYRRRR
jgi:hypothetical protein